MIDLVVGLGQASTGVKDLLNGKILAIVRPNLINDPTIVDPNATGFVFDIPTGETQDFESDTTDHYTENGSFMNDHIVNKPKKITLTGYVGELVYRKPNPSSISGGIRQLSGRLASLAGLGGNYTPGFIQTAQGLIAKAQAAANQVNQIAGQIQSAAGIISSFFGSQKITKQRAAYDRLYGFWNSKTIFTITTPWDELSPMVITGMSFRQDQDSGDYTTITISFKEFRFAGTKFTKLTGADALNNIPDVQAQAQEAGGPAGSNKTSLREIQQSGGNILGGVTKAFGAQ